MLEFNRTASILQSMKRACPGKRRFTTYFPGALLDQEINKILYLSAKLRRKLLDSLLNRVHPMDLFSGYGNEIAIKY